MKFIPSFEYENQYWQQGIKVIAGVDEVGMGALAGPVVAAAVVFDPKIFPPDIIRDSKLLSAPQRDRALKWIKDNALHWSISQSSVEEISSINIRAASHLAMRRSLDSINVHIELALIDGNPAQPHPTIPAVNIIKGDQKSFSIAAASILAKVYRDELMIKLGEQYPAYGFASHKGYGAALHLSALQQYGACPEHRVTYAPVRAVLTKLPSSAKLQRTN